MSFVEWLPLFFICVLGAVSPGPSFILIVKHAISHSPRHGIVAAIAHATGIATYALLTIVGISAIIISSAELFQVIVYLGAGFLAWLGWKALRSQPKSLHFNVEVARPVSLCKAASDGFAIAVLNPKSAIFFTALFSQFVDSDNMTWQTAAILLLTPWLVDAIWFCWVSVFIQKFKKWLASEKGVNALNKISGVLFIVLAIKAVVGF